MMRTLKGTLTGAMFTLLAIAGSVVLVGCGDALSAEPTLEVAASQAPADLAGTWVLNVELSERPDRPAPGDGDGPPGPRGHRPEGRPDGAVGDGPRGMRPGGPGMRGAGHGALEIAVNEETVSFTRGSGRTVLVYPDGRTVTETVGRGEWTHEMQVTARWTDDGLSIERMTERGTVVEIFAVSADGQQLYVDATLSRADRDESVTFRRVYDRVTE